MGKPDAGPRSFPELRLPHLEENPIINKQHDYSLPSRKDCGNMHNMGIDAPTAHADGAKSSIEQSVIDHRATRQALE